MPLNLKLLIFICVLFLVKNAFANESITFHTSLTEDESQLLLPIPNHLILIDASFKLFEMDRPINIKYKVLNHWPTIDGQKNIRLLLIEVDHISGNNLPLQLKWNNKKLNKKIFNLKVQENLKLVYPSSNWLAQSLLLHPAAMSQNLDWYTEPLSKYSNYFTDQKALTQNGHPQNKASQWLYDRAQAIYQLFILSNNNKWLDKGDSLLNFYIKNIDNNGLFKLIDKQDIKYLMPKGLLYRYFLSADDEAQKALTKIYQSSLTWDPEYDLKRGFWTERNQAAALNTAISYWEITGDSSAVTRINHIINATVKMTFNPINDWELVGCPQHTFKSHEGNGGHTAVCSPWMMALLSDALWRYYRLTGDVRAASLIDAFGDFVLNHGIYWGNEKVGNVVIPKYLVSLKNARYENLDQWTDHQHTCDVAALLGKSVYIKRINKVDDLLLTELFSAFIQQCKMGFENAKKKHKSSTNWAFVPPRRFGWTFSTTSDLPWLVDLLLSENN